MQVCPCGLYPDFRRKTTSLHLIAVSFIHFCCTVILDAVTSSKQQDSPIKISLKNFQKCNSWFTFSRLRMIVSQAPGSCFIASSWHRAVQSQSSVLVQWTRKHSRQYRGTVHLFICLLRCYSRYYSLSVSVDMTSWNRLSSSFPPS